MRERFVIVGASLAGATAAATLRDEGFEGDVILIGDEPEIPYERPPLSKEYLRGEQSFEKAFVRPPEFYEENIIDLRLRARAVRVQPSVRTVELADGASVVYDKLLITTGSRNRRPVLAGRELEGLYDLRTLADCERIKAEATSGRTAVLVGMGFIGCEVAASLRELGLNVTAVEGFDVPLQWPLGEEVGRVIEGIHRDQGVSAFLGDGAARFEGSHRLEAVVTESGHRLECDFAVVGVGVEPAVDVVEGSGIEVDDGILVDEYCRTNAEDVFAAGDVTNHYHPIPDRHLRVEHWQNALKQSVAAARAMLGKAEPYDEVHWFWSDQYDYNIQYAGFDSTGDELVVRGSLDERNFVAFYMKAGRVAASVGVNRPKDLRRSMRLIKAGLPVEAAKLKDEDVDLRKLAEPR